MGLETEFETSFYLLIFTTFEQVWSTRQFQLKNEISTCMIHTV